jgi:hypothetical protein
VAARDLKPGDVLQVRGWRVLTVDRPLADDVIRLTLLKPKSGRKLAREYGVDELIAIERRR